MSQRSDNVTLARIQEEIMRMLVDLKPYTEICDHIGNKYQKSDTTVRGYVAQALATLRERTLEDIDAVREANRQHLLEKYNEMLADYSEKKNPKYMQLALSFYDRYVKLFPNGLEPEIVDNEKQINITFNDLGKKDD